MKPGTICRIRGTIAPAAVLTEVADTHGFCEVEYFWNNQLQRTRWLLSELEEITGRFPNQNREDEMYV